MSKRRYAIKNNKTNKFLVQVQRSWNKNKFLKSLVWVDKFPTENYMHIDTLNMLIEQVIDCSFQSELDDCEIETVEIRYIPVKGSVKMKAWRNRLEQRALVNKLKGH